jgi:putative phosphoribosyl transferase
VRGFADRADAGRRLGERLAALRGRPDVIVLGLPRGGVPVAAEIARALDAPLDVLVVRKLGLPTQPELAMGAVASGGALVLNLDVTEGLGVPDEEVERVARRELAAVEEAERRLRGGRAPPDLTGRTVLLVDDGLATGATMRAAVRAARAQGPGRIIVAVPVASGSAVADLGREAEDVVALIVPRWFPAVGAAYRDFAPVPDEEVVRLLGLEEPTGR